MQESYLSLIAFPYTHKGEKKDGLILDWPQKCGKCQRNICFDGVLGEIMICSNGYNYVKVSKNISLGGFILKEFATSTPARKKNLKNDKDHIVNSNRIERCVTKINKFTDSLQYEIEQNKERVVNEYIKNESYKDDFLQTLESKMKEAFSSLHDFKQFAAQVSQNINVVIETRYDGVTLEAKLEKAEHAEKAIYWLSKMMDKKLITTKFVAHPEMIEAAESISLFSLHGLVLKYLRIYEMNFRAKGISPAVLGHSYGKILCNPDAVGVIIQTFIDNAYKYTPKGQNVEIYFEENDEKIDFSISSYGPIIKKNEEEKIFQPFQRAISAKKLEEDGTGFGLFISSVIATRLQANITFTQDRSQIFMDKYYWTTFSASFERSA